jgi:hypothetical protein
MFVNLSRSRGPWVSSTGTEIAVRSLSSFGDELGAMAEHCTSQRILHGQNATGA